MSDVEDFATWLVNNQDQAGSPEFDTVARAFQELDTPTRQIPLGQLTPEEDILTPGEREYGLGELFGRSVRRGGSRLQSTFADLIPAIAASAVGADEYAERQLQEAAAKEEQLAEVYPRVVPSYTDVEDIKTGLQYGVETIGEQLPNLAEAIGTGLGVGKIAKGLATRGARKEVRDRVARRQLTEGAAEEATKRLTTAAVPSIQRAQRTGQMAGAFLGSYAINAPEVFENVYRETGSIEPSVALLWGSASAALDSVLPYSISRSIAGPLKARIVGKVLEESGVERGALRTVATALARGTAIEGLTEGAQEAISISAEKFVAENPDVWGSEEWSRIMESAVAGAVAGGAFGSAGGAARAGRNALENKLVRDIEARMQADAEAVEENWDQNSLHALQQEEGSPAAVKAKGRFGKQARRDPLSVPAQIPPDGADGQLTAYLEWIGIPSNNNTRDIFNRHRDLSNTVQATQLKADLKKWADGKAVATQAAVEAFLKRPEFEGVPDVESKWTGPQKTKPKTEPKPKSTTDEIPLQEGEDTARQAFIDETLTDERTVELLATAGKKEQEAGVAPTTDTVTYSDGEVTWTFSARDDGDGTYTVSADNNTTGPHGTLFPTFGWLYKVKAGSVSEAIDVFHKTSLEETYKNRQRNKDRVAKVKKESPDLLPELEANIQMQDRLIKMLEGQEADAATEAAPAKTEREKFLRLAKEAEETGDDEAADFYRSQATVARLKAKGLTDEEIAAGFSAAVKAQADKLGFSLREFMEELTVSTKEKIDILRGAQRELSRIAATRYSIPLVAKDNWVYVEQLAKQGLSETEIKKIVSKKENVTPLLKQHRRILDVLKHPRQRELTVGETGELELMYPIDTTVLDAGKIPTSKGSKGAVARKIAKRKDFATVENQIELVTSLFSAFVSAKNTSTKWNFLEFAFDTDLWALEQDSKTKKWVYKNPGKSPTPEEAAKLYFNDRSYSDPSMVLEAIAADLVITRPPFTGNEEAEFRANEEKKYINPETNEIKAGVRLTRPQIQTRINKEVQNYKDSNALYKTTDPSIKAPNIEAARLTAQQAKEWVRGNLPEVMGVNPIEMLEGHEARYEAARKEGATRNATINRINSLAKEKDENNRLVKRVIAATAATQRAVRADQVIKAAPPRAIKEPIWITTELLNELGVASTWPGRKFLKNETPYSPANQNKIAAALAKYKPRNKETKEKVAVFLKKRRMPAPTPTHEQVAQQLKEARKRGVRVTELPAQKIPQDKKAGAPGAYFASPTTFKGAKFNEEKIKLAEEGKFKELLTKVIPSQSAVPQQILRKVQTLNLKTKLRIGPLPDNKPGAYNSAEDVITLNPEAGGMSEGIFMHEVSHAALAQALNNPDLELTKQFFDFFSQIKNQLGDTDGGADLHEFTSELLNNGGFVALLKSIKAPRSQSMWMNIIDAIAGFFGFRRGQSAYGKAIKFINDILDVSHGIEPSYAEELFLTDKNPDPIIKAIIDSVPKTTPEKARSTIVGIEDTTWKRRAFGLARLDNIQEMYGNFLPIQPLIDWVELRQGFQENRIKEYVLNYRRFERIDKQFPQATKTMWRMAWEARVGRFDLISKTFKPKADSQAEYDRLKGIYNRLPKEVRSMYVLMRHDYDQAYIEFRDSILRDAGKSDPTGQRAANLRKQFDLNLPIIGYVPSRRFGEFLLEWVDADTNERYVRKFEKSKERTAFEAALRDKGAYLEDEKRTSTLAPGTEIKIRDTLPDAEMDVANIPPGDFVNKVVEALKDVGESDEHIEAVLGTYYQLFPEGSITKSFIPAKEIPGMSSDAVRVYGDTMVKWARKMANVKYSPEIQKGFTAIDKAARDYAQRPVKKPTDPPLSSISAANQNIQDRKNFTLNPVYSKAVSFATSGSYSLFLLGNVSSALVNLTAIGLLTYPILGGKFSYPKATTALMEASKLAMNFGKWGDTVVDGNTPYKKLYDELQKHALLEHTMQRELIEGARQSTEEYNSQTAHLMNVLSYPFAYTEIYNRGTTGIAAYKLAKDDGMAETDAIEFAKKTIKDVNTSGMAATAPRYMQMGAGRVFFTFKQFIWQSAYVTARALEQSIAGESPEVRKIARRQALGIFAMSAAIAGVNGLPFYGAAATFANMIAALIPDDEEEPFNAKEEMRMFTGEFAYKGFFNWLLNWEISNRASVANGLLFRDDPYSIAEHGYVLTAMSQAFGPLGSYTLGLESAARYANNGLYSRAIEQISPSFIRNGFKGFRYMREGVLTSTGQPIAQNLSAWNLATQFIGFSPSSVASLYETRALAMNFQTKVMARRSTLLRRRYLAIDAGDMDLLKKTDRQIYQFRRQFPTVMKPGAERRSFKSRKALEKEMQFGLRFNQNLIERINERYFFNREFEEL